MIKKVKNVCAIMETNFIGQATIISNVEFVIYNEIGKNERNGAEVLAKHRLQLVARAKGLAGFRRKCSRFYRNNVMDLKTRHSPWYATKVRIVKKMIKKIKKCLRY